MIDCKDELAATRHQLDIKLQRTLYEVEKVIYRNEAKIRVGLMRSYESDGTMPLL
jgi:hypothetical protein